MINNNRSLDKSGFVKLIGFLFLGLLAACATGNPYEIAKVTIPTLKSDMGRIFVYRKLNPIALLKPKVFFLNGKPIADTYMDSIIYHDVKPGNHTVNYKKGNGSLAINIQKGEKVYIEFEVVSDTTDSGNLIIKAVDRQIAKNEIKSLRLIEKKIRYPDELD